MNEAIARFIDRLGTKLTSGQFLLTIVAGMVFAYASYAGKIEPQAMTAIIASVFALYFQRDRTEKKP